MFIDLTFFQCLTPVVSTVMCGILLARFRIVDYVSDQGEKKGGGEKKKLS